MKKIFLISTAIFSFACTYAQTIPNADFESWTLAGPFETPDGWAAGPSVSKSTSAHSGTYAIQLKTDTFTNPMTSTLDTIPGMANTGMRGLGPGAGGTNGYAFTSRPDSLVGWYLFTPIAGEMSTINVNLTKWNTGTSSNDIVGTASFLGGATGTYTRFSIPITYSSTDIPDTANIDLINGDPMMRLIGATLLVDDLAFISNLTGISDVRSTTISMQCYPNPVNDIVHVAHTKGTEISLYSAVGMLIESIDNKGNDVIEFNVSSLSNGLYFIRASNGEVEKVIINH